MHVLWQNFMHESGSCLHFHHCMIPFYQHPHIISSCSQQMNTFSWFAVTHETNLHAAHIHSGEYVVGVFYAKLPPGASRSPLVCQYCGPPPRVVALFYEVVRSST